MAKSKQIIRVINRISSRRIERIKMLQSGFEIRTSIFTEKWLAWFYCFGLNSGSKGRLIVSMLISFGFRPESEQNYLRLPSVVEDRKVCNLSQQQINISILSSSGQEILRNLTQLNNCNQD